MAELFIGLGTALSAAVGAGGTAAAGTAASLVPGIGAAAAAGAAGTAGSGISLASILSGAATVLGVVASLGAGQANSEAALAEAEKLDLQAGDAEREQALETLQGVERRSSIRRALVEALGEQDVAYAGSGVDLSFGTARQARQDAYREADLGLTSDTGTEITRVSRLQERAANYRDSAARYRVSAKRAKSLGRFNAAIGGLRGFANAVG